MVGVLKLMSCHLYEISINLSSLLKSLIQFIIVFRLHCLLIEIIVKFFLLLNQNQSLMEFHVLPLKYLLLLLKNQYHFTLRLSHLNLILPLLKVITLKQNCIFFFHFHLTGLLIIKDNFQISYLMPII